MIAQFLLALKDYLIEVSPFLAMGFFLGGLIHEFLPTKWVDRHLSGKGIKPIIYATLAGTALPICCIGSLPVAVSLRQKGASLGPVLAFLVATPATSVSALLVCYALLGIRFTAFIFAAVIAMGFVIGVIGNSIKVKDKASTSQNKQLAVDPVCGMNVETEKGIKTDYRGKTYYFCSLHCQQLFKGSPQEYLETSSKNIARRMKHVFRYAFVDMVKEIGPELVLGLVLAALVVAITPVGRFVGTHFSGSLGYLFSLGFGLAMYICSTASVPLVDAFISQGMNVGAGMVLLIVGPITSWGALLVLRKEFGRRTLLIYLAVICAMALALGYSFSIIA